jgi:dihydrofolate reductase
MKNSHPRLSAIAALSENRVIGINNQLPWHLPADLKHFKTLTTGHPIVMGRKTYESIGRPLPNRTNIILTRDANYQAPGCFVFNDINSAMQSDAVQNANEIFIIGGAMIYAELLPQIERLYLTIVKTVIEGDAFFPEIIANEWQEVGRESHEADEANLYAYDFVLMERK